MPKTPDEIKKGLECCATVKVGGVCPFDCPLQPLCESGDDGAVQREILSIIQRLQADNAEKDARIKQLEAERDAAVKDMNRNCFICKNFGRSECLNTVCAECASWCNWQWRGVQKEE